MHVVIPPVEDEIELIIMAPMGVTLNEEGLNDAKIEAYQKELSKT
jgi:hypothetical protein